MVMVPNLRYIVMVPAQNEPAMAFKLVRIQSSALEKVYRLSWLSIVVLEWYFNLSQKL